MTLKLTRNGERLLNAIKIISKKLNTYDFRIIAEQLMKFEQSIFDKAYVYPFGITYIVDEKGVNIDNQHPYYEKNQIETLIDEAYLNEEDALVLTYFSPREQKLLENVPIQHPEVDKIMYNLLEHHKDMLLLPLILKEKTKDAKLLQLLEEKAQENEDIKHILGQYKEYFRIV